MQLCAVCKLSEMAEAKELAIDVAHNTDNRELLLRVGSVLLLL